MEVRPQVTVCEPANVILAVTENNLASNVGRGENKNLKVIGFLQEQQGRRIIGAGWSTVRNQAATQ